MKRVREMIREPHETNEIIGEKKKKTISPQKLNKIMTFRFCKNRPQGL
jgi:hypothetical protein